MAVKSSSYNNYKVSLAALGVSLFMAGTSFADGPNGPVNLYSYRQSFLMAPLLDAFTAETGITVNAVYAKNGILQRLKAEGMNSPADVVLAADITRIDEIAQAGLLSPVSSDVLEQNIGANYRHPENLWFGMTYRARVIFAHKDRVTPGEIKTYEDLADPRFKGRICIRSGKHEYNITLLASMINALGKEKAENWLNGLKENLARRPQGNDRAQVNAIYEGECDISVGNSYYLGNMATNEEKPEEKKWASAVNIIFPNQPDSTTAEASPTARGAHVNISAAGMTKSAKHQKEAILLLEFLASDKAQKIYAAENFEYPLKKGVAVHPMVASWGKFKADTQRLSDIAALHIEATKMMDRVGFDN
ncbi:MAG: Fe(3+) ABC transporter substrate-binding protein [Rhodospirillaceae bacterium]|nr:Fe(3+) ABC transporter substrate-binding protein [Rhodospirillaceae bacterium]